MENTLKGIKQRRFINDVIRATMIVEQNIFEVIGEKGHSIVKPTHTHFQVLFIKTYLKLLKTILNVSVIRPLSGSF